MKCFYKNTCKHKYLCCHYCKERCDVRCKDDYKRCDSFYDVKINSADDEKVSPRKETK